MFRRRGAEARDLLVVVPTVLVLWVLPLVSARLTGRSWQLHLGDQRVEPVPTPEWLFWLGVLLAAAAAVATLLRRRFPIPCFAVALTATLLAGVLWLSSDVGVLFGLCFATVAEHHGRRSMSRWAVAGCVAALVLCVAQALHMIQASNLYLALTVRWGDVYLWFASDHLMLAVLVLVGSWQLGVRSRLLKEQVAREAVLAERLRLRREIHDVLSHSLSTIGVQAGVAVQVPGQTKETLLSLLGEIEHDAREGLRQLREILDEDTCAPDRTLRPALDQAMHQVRATGAVVLLEDGDKIADRALPPAVALTAQRLIQESLTNTVRHARAQHCWITLASWPGGITVRVVDDGVGVADLRPGHGISGMRERVEQCGGRVSFSNVSEGTGFQVEARIPVGRR
ncbi:MAG: histidine kinase [Arachnia propionica]|uniref:sensor histidine kinase n=1 Tax=Arachnia propionica TaxID=1750 RepID=UPI0026FC608B|nr:histidine kinase [Arachnia propionica]